MTGTGCILRLLYLPIYAYVILVVSFLRANLPEVGGVPRGVVWGVQPPPPKFLSFDKVEPDCKLSGKCIVFLFQQPN
jgi:hypothetical protein